MLDRFHPPVEEYLETIFALEEEGIPVIQARLAERLDKAAPSVSEMLDEPTRTMRVPLACALVTGSVTAPAS